MKAAAVQGGTARCNSIHYPSKQRKWRLWFIHKAGFFCQRALDKGRSPRGNNSAEKSKEQIKPKMPPVFHVAPGRASRLSRSAQLDGRHDKPEAAFMFCFCAAAGQVPSFIPMFLLQLYCSSLSAIIQHYLGCTASIKQLSGSIRE